MSTRFTAVIKIVKVEETAAVTSRYDNQNVPASSKDTELANIVVRNVSLENLLAKTKSHLDLVEE